jgi:hypothetical protein
VDVSRYNIVSGYIRGATFEGRDSKLILSLFFHLSPFTFHTMQTKLQNQAIVDAIASKIISELYNRVRYHHATLHLEVHKYHEDCINEREIIYDDFRDVLSFNSIWDLIINTELYNLYESLEGYSQKAVRDYVRDVYPDWRDSID